MKIFIILEGPFPYGLAATIRLISYAKGLVKLSKSVQVLCLKPTENESDKIRNKNINGVFEGIEYQYLSGTTIRPASTTKRIFLYLKGVSKTLIYIRSTSRHEKVDAIFMGISNFPVTFFFFLLSRIYKIKFIHERSEYPFLSSSKSLIKKLKLQIYLKVTLKLFDGLIVITSHLENYFKSKIRKNSKTMILPILVEPERFNNIKKENDQLVRNITYCGSMEGNKDGVPILIDAFKIITAKHKNVNLVLIGDTNFPSFNQLVEKIDDLQIRDKVELKGRVERDKIPQLLINATMLALARPVSIQAQGGFPTKLGEYLATGNPAIVTRVGEIPLYLKDNLNALIAEPDSAIKFAEKIDFVLSNPEKARAIGQEGKKLTQTIFNYKQQAKNLVDFINTL
jgi:glycosyltransferase involved in cell wall biosynthesis